MIRAIVISAVLSVWASIATAQPAPDIYIAGDQQYDQLGAAIDQNHDQMVIGAPTAFVVADGDGFVQALSKTFGAWGPQGVTGGIFGRFEAGFPTDHDYLGHAVDVDRNLLGEFVAVLGASGTDSIVQDNTGAAYVLVNSGGSWTQVHRLDPFDVDNDEPTPQHDFFAQRGVDPTGGQFGRAVAVHGDLIAIGIPYASARPGTGMDMLQEAGAVAIYHRNGGSWELEAVLSRASSDTCALDIHQQDYFGYSVAISGQYLAVGTPLADDPHMTNDGVCWFGGCLEILEDVCDLLGGTWLPGQSCDTAVNPVAGIGACCYLEASSCTWHAIDTIIEIECLTSYGGTWIPGQQADDITCPIIDNSPLNDNIGEVHIFRRDSASNWEHYVTLRPPIHVLPADPDYRLVDSWFGLSVAMSGSTLAVGQPGYLRPDKATPEQPGGRGMAWAFERTSGSDPWTLLTALDPNLPVGIDLLAPLEDGYNYGWSVDTSSCHIAVGAPGGDFNSTSYAGSAYVWDHIGLGVWSGTTTTDTNPVGYLAPFFSPDSGDRWGHDVSVTVHDFAMGGPRNTHDVLIPGVYVGGIETWDTPCNCDTPNGPEDDCDGDGCSDTWQILIDPTLDLAGNIGGDCHDVDPNGWPEGDGVLDACQMGYGAGSFSTPNGNLYQVVLDPNTTFTNAMADPRLDTSGVDLASLSTWLEGYYVAVAAGWNGPLWLGGQQLSTTGADDEGWAWNSGEVWFWTNWEEGPPQQPDNGGPLTDALLASGNNVPWTWSDEVTDSIMADGYLIEYDSDCNRNMVLDVWEIREALNNSGLVLDCEDDCVLDACQIANGTRLDCNGNGIPDQCDLTDGTSEDCNTNNVPDECDVATGGASEDCNANGIPDECEFVTCPVVVINEVLVKPNSDVNGDGTSHPGQDQYVEIVNSTSTAIPLGGWEVRVDGLSWHVFAGGTVIEANCAILVFGGGVPNPLIFPPNIDLFTALNGQFLGLPIPGPGLTTVMELWDGEDIPNLHDVVLWDDEANTSGTSVTRCPDVVGQALPLIVHDSCTSLDRSPGLLVDGSFFLCSTDDSDGDDIPDIDDNCPDVFNPDQADCDGNGIGDACDPFTDCNINLIPDVCDIADGTSEDCNTNDVPDECDIANDTSEDCNSNGIPDECEVDCNSNGIPDDCDIADGTSEDCNLNGIPDECDDDCNGNDIPDDCDIADGTSEDCNSNGIPDDCDITDGTSEDCNLNGIPDECDDDCNGNGIPDDCDIADGTSEDCNLNGIPDECDDDCNGNGIPDDCDIADGTSEDCNLNGIPDECEDDCNFNGIPDDCDIADGTSEDCNFNGIPDECEDDCNFNGIPDDCDIADGTSEDCNFNGIPDECEDDCNSNGIPDDCDITDGTSTDCNSNGLPDECEPFVDCNLNGIFDPCDIADGTSEDCNGNSIPDECDIAVGTSEDCNSNGVPDECDIFNGTSYDCNSNGIPDECECVGDITGAVSDDPDGIVGIDDLLFLIGAWGVCPDDCPADIFCEDNLEIVGVDDLLLMVASWGPCG